MPYETQLHQPGDLIPSDDWNAISAAVAALEGRVTVLEARPGAGNAPIISGRDPQGDVAVSSRLTVLGHNFLVPADQNTVTLGSAAITQFLSGSDDEHLVFQIPNVFTGLPQTLPLAVANRNGTSAPLTVRVLPSGTPQGGIVVLIPQTPAGQTPHVGDQVRFEWDVDSQTVVPEHYLLRPVFSNATGVTVDDWAATATVDPASVTRIARGNPVRAKLLVTVPVGGQSVDVALEAVAQDHAELTRTSFVEHLEVGTAVTPSDPRTTLTLLPLPPLNEASTAANPGREATIDGASGVEVQFGERAYLQVHAHFTVNGRYRFATEVAGGGGEWTAEVSPAGDAESAGVTIQLDIGLERTTAAPASPARLLTVTAAKRNAANTADEFVSYIRFPVRGYTPGP